MSHHGSLILSCTIALLGGLAGHAGAAEKPKKIVLIAGPITGHPKETHEYEKTVPLLKHLLDTSPSLRDQVRVEAHFKGWPQDPSTLEDADAIFLTSDGCDRRETDHPLYVGNRLTILERQMRRGCGLVFFHWSTFNPARFHEQITEWAGGYFDYETGPGPRKWYSAIQTWQAAATLGTPDHPIARGVKPFNTQEEYYYRMRFRDQDPRLKPIVLTRPPNETNDFAVGWAVERAEGGRGFGFTGGHFYQNWWNADFRKLILNAIAWTAKLDVPASGVESEPFERFKALILTGHNHPAHDWRAVTAALILALEQDPRAIVHVTEQIDELAAAKIHDYGLLVMNYNNWDRAGLSDAAKANFIRYLQNGGGLSVIHFANGAFNPTLPNKESDWPEYRTNIVRRVWMAGQDRSGHDHYGPFRVEMTDVKHPITVGLRAFDTIDELYYRQEGELPIEPLATARSKITGQDEPMAWAYAYGKGRVFQTVLGHADESVRQAAALIRRGSVWAANRRQISFDPPAELTEGALFRAGSPWTPEASRKRTEGPRWRFRPSPLMSALAFPSPRLSPLGRGKEFLISEPFHGRRSDPRMAREGALPINLVGTDSTPSLTFSASPKRTSVTRWNTSLPGPWTQRGMKDWGILPHWERAGVRASFTRDNILAAKPPTSNSPTSKAPTVLPPNIGLDQGGKFGHWGDEGETNWVDSRWNRTESGPFFSSSLQTPAGVALKSIAIRVGDDREGGVCFDAGQLNLKTGWIGGFLRKSPQRFGVIEMPRIEGRIAFASVDGPAWGDAPTRYRGFYVHGERVVLSYEAGGMPVLDAPWLKSCGDLKIFTRTLELGPTVAPRRLSLLNAKDRNATLTSGSGWSQALLENVTNVLAVSVNGAEVDLAKSDAGTLTVGFAASKMPRLVKILLWSGDKTRLDEFRAFAKQSEAPDDLAALTQPGPPRWTEPIFARGHVASGPGPLVIDTLTLPYENPYQALWFTSGHDFFDHGDAAVCTVHGDVWRVSGIDDRLDKLTWKRMATGLFQALGLRIVKDTVYVIGRDQITRLRDLNGDGETDFYENFHNGIQTSAGGHDYVTCLETDREGNFYYLDPLGLHRVSADGSRSETLARGWRNPNGMSVSPEGVITVSPQEGEWTPASFISEVKAGGYFGYGGPKVTADRPLGYDPPLCWIPRYLDNSCGGEVWVPRDHWGPLGGQLLHLAYGRCQMQLVLREIVHGRPQGALVPIKGRFLSGIMRGRFRPQDGHLYLTGLKGWVTSALRDGCFQRVRYTGEKLSLPIAFHIHSNGLRLTFSEPLDRALAGDVENYGLEQWNYRYAAEYGSKEYSARQPGVEGHDSVELRRAILLNDCRTVFLEIPGLKPVMQLQVQYDLTDQDGAAVRGKLIATVNRLGAAYRELGVTNSPNRSLPASR